MSIDMAVVLVALAVAVVQVVRGWKASGERLPGVLLVLAGSWVAGALLDHLAHRAGDPAPLTALAYACGLAGWTCLTRLGYHRLRARQLFAVVPFTLFALMTLGLTGDAMFVEVLFAWPALARVRWSEDVSPKVAGFAALGAMALAIGAFALPHEAAPSRTVFWGDPTRFDAWARWMIGGCGLAMVPGLVRRWSLGLRRVQARLVVLIVLAGLVPPALIGALWAVSSVLGTNADRAARAGEWLDAESRELRAALADALAGADTSAVALRTVPDTRAPRWDALRVWDEQGGQLRQVRGAPLRDGAAVPGWPSDRAEAIVFLDGRPWIGALHRDSLRGRRVLALLPVDSLMIARLSQVSRAEVRVEALGVPDSFAADTAQRRRGLHFSVESDRGTFTDDRVNALRGMALRGGLSPGDSGWVNRLAVVTARTPPSRLATELVVSVRDNPLNYFPVFLIGALVVALAVTLTELVRMVRALGGSIATAVAALRGGASALEQGQLEHRIAVAGRDDLWDVATAFNRMAEGLERGRRTEAERRRLEDEMDLARRIQERLLPQETPQLAGYDLAGATVPARHVGGDYYDFVPLADQRVALVIADVSGKGVAAGLLMSAFRAALQTQPLDGAPLADVVARINGFLHRSVEPGRFVTAFLAILDGRDGAITYINAGHNAPMLQHAGGAIERLEAGGPVLGILPEWPWVQGVARLERGSRLVLFTDGVTEAQNPSGALWEDDGLLGSLARHPGGSARSTLEGVIADVRAFEAGAPPTDDVTLLIARRDA